MSKKRLVSALYPHTESQPTSCPLYVRVPRKSPSFSLQRPPSPRPFQTAEHEPGWWPWELEVCSFVLLDMSMLLGLFSQKRVFDMLTMSVAFIRITTSPTN
jgi:hypothetical protein